MWADCSLKLTDIIMNILTKSIPNTITILNLLAGCYAVVAALSGDLVTAFYCMVASLVFDFCDGFAARLLKAYSPMGKELDSLADMVSFGVVPSCIVFTLGVEWLGFIIAAFSALRLAKFNIDTRQTEQFIGLATPANAIFFGAIGYISQTEPDSLFMCMMNEKVILGCAVVLSLLLVSEIPMFSLKFKSYAFSKNKLVYSFVLLSLLSLIFFHVTAIPFIVATYILVSVIQKLIKK